MKKPLLGMGMLLLTFTLAFPQAPYKVFTAPKLPTGDVLKRMNLTMAWNTRLRTSGHRDGVYSVQVIPGKKNPQLVVQTYEGAVYLFDAENGDLIWKTKVGPAYWSPQPVAFNAQSIFATRRNVLHVINRFNGQQRVYTVKAGSHQVDFGYEMDFAPSAAPIADDTTVYVSMGNRVQAFAIPDFDREAALKQKEEQARRELFKNDPALRDLYKQEPQKAPENGSINLNSPQPEYQWGYLMSNQITEFSPLVGSDLVGILTTDGTLISVARAGFGEREEFFDPPFRTTGRIAAAGGQHGVMAYVGSDDYSLYAINMHTNDLVWRHVAGAPILQKPDVTDEDVFIAPQRVGLRRLDRFTGKAMWTNRDATRFLAVTANYVYALDHLGKFYVLDGRRGTTLARTDLSAWTIAVPNEMTDRIYLAANDGQVVCLRHRDQMKPVIKKTVVVPKLEEKVPMFEMKKDEEMKKEEEKKKDEEKKDDKKDEKKDAARRIQAAPAMLALNLSATPPERVSHLTSQDRRRWAGP